MQHMTSEQRETAAVYEAIPLQTRLRILDDLVAFSKSEGEPLVRAGIMLACNRIMSQATRNEREKRRKNG